MSYYTGESPAHKPVGPGLQIFGLIILPLVMNYEFIDSLWGEVKTLLRSQSVVNVSAY